MSIVHYAENDHGLANEAVFHALQEAVAPYGAVKKALILPPDMTRGNSYAGPITCRLYEMLGQDCHLINLCVLEQYAPHDETKRFVLLLNDKSAKFLLRRLRFYHIQRPSIRETNSFNRSDFGYVFWGKFLNLRHITSFLPR